ncbi:MAG: translocation/assembly module TamB domain-containing protein [Gammaproteobacteria bacterium]|nr:translocation/assembly module TamB domain-containing protein [Gammaproteobacteria bacterium]
MCRLAIAIPVGAATAFAAALLWLSATQSGLTTALHLAERLTAGAVSVAHAQGSLWGPLTLVDVRYRDASGPRVWIRTLDFDWHRRDGALVVRTALAGVRYNPVTAAPATGEAGIALPDLTFPFPVTIDQLRVTDFRLGTAAAPLLDEATLSARGNGDQLRDIALTLTRGDDALALRGQITTSGSYPFALATDWHWSRSPGQTLAGTGGLEGSLATLHLYQQLSGLASGELDATVHDPLTALAWKLELKFAALDLAALTPGRPGAVATGVLQAAGDLTSARMTGQLVATGVHDHPLEAGFELGYRDQLVEISRLRLSEKGVDSLLDLSGQVHLGDAAVGFDIDGDLALGARTLPSGRQLRATRAAFTVAGTPDQYQLAGSAKIQLDDLPEAEITIAGSGDTTQFAAHELTLTADASRLSGKAALSWNSGITWEGDFVLANLDPALFASQWPGQVSGAIRTRGSYGDKLSAQVQLQNIAGHVRDLPARASGRFELVGAHLTIEQFAATLGNASVHANGTLNDHWQLAFSAEVPDLTMLAPSARGRIALKGELSGSQSAPRVALDLALNRLSYADLKLRQLTLQGSADLAPTGVLDIAATGADLAVGGLAWHTLSARITGARDSHRITAALLGSALSVRLTGHGGITDKLLWRGAITGLRVDAGRYGKWQQVADATLTLGRGRIALDQICLRDTPALACLDARLTPNETGGTVSLTELPFALFRDLLPDGLDVTGALDASVHWSRTAIDAVRVDASVTTTTGEISFAEGAEKYVIPLLPSHAQLHLDDTGLAAQIALRLDSADRLDAELSLPGWRLRLRSPTPQQQPLLGKLTLSTSALHLSDAYVKSIAHPAGQLRADLSVSGTLSEPLINGRLTLADGRADLPALGLELRSIGLRVSGAATERLALTGELTSGAGVLTLDGWWDPALGNATLAVRGTNLSVANTSELQLDATPDLQLTLTGNLIDIKGRVTIPHARIEPQSVPENAVTVSRDVRVIQTTATKTGPTRSRWRLRTDLSIVLGDDVRFEGFGVRGTPAGSIRLVREPERQARVSGTLSLGDGSYVFRGREIPIVQGRVIYADSALDDPGVDVVAARDIGDITAGLHLSGSLQTPSMKLYSRPKLPDSDILSYLLLGRPMGQASASDAALLMSAATGTGLSQGEALAKSLGSQLGLDEVRIQSSEGLETSALVLGRYLSPRIYIRYLTGLLDAVQKVQLSYKINKHLEWRVESGEGAGTDIFYTIKSPPNVQGRR